MNRRKLERLAGRHEEANFDAPLRRSKLCAGPSPKISLPDLTPFQARKTRAVLRKAADDPDLSPRTRELCAWLAMRIEEQL